MKLVLQPANPRPLASIPTFRPASNFLPPPAGLDGTCYPFSPAASSIPTPRRELIHLYDGKWFFTASLPSLLPSLQDNHALVLFTDGACTNNGRPDARAGWGVFAGFEDRGCPYNLWGRLEADVPQTNGRAEIEGLKRAARLARGMVKEYPFLNEVWIVCDSEYLVKAMTVWMVDWLRKGGRKSSGGQVEHWEVLKEVWHDLRVLSERFCGVALWWVPRERNKAADELSKRGLLEEVGVVRGGEDPVVRRAFGKEEDGVGMMGGIEQVF